MISKIRERFSEWSHQRYLKKRGWNEESYRRHTDARINRQAHTIADYYQGYNTVFEFTSARVDPFTSYPSWSEAYAAMNLWCREYCKGAWRHDIHRVYHQTGLDELGNEHPNWHFNEIGGGDVLFYAFEDPLDATVFALKWK